MKALSSILLIFICLSSIVEATERNEPFTALELIPDLKNSITEYAAYK